MINSTFFAYLSIDAIFVGEILLVLIHTLCYVYSMSLRGNKPIMDGYPATVNNSQVTLTRPRYLDLTKGKLIEQLCVFAAIDKKLCTT